MTDVPVWRVTIAFEDGAGKRWKQSAQIASADPWQAQRVASYTMRRAMRGRGYRGRYKAWAKATVDRPVLVAGSYDTAGF